MKYVYNWELYVDIYVVRLLFLKFVFLYILLLVKIYVVLYVVVVYVDNNGYDGNVC